MIRKLTVKDRYRWLRATLEQLASVPCLSDADLTYLVFEVLDPDVRSSFHGRNLDPLVEAAHISRATKQELLEIRATFLALLEAAHADSSCCEKIRRDEQWMELSRRSSRLFTSLNSSVGF